MFDICPSTAIFWFISDETIYQNKSLCLIFDLDWCFIFFCKIVVDRHFSYYQNGFQNGHQRSRDYFYYNWFKWKFYILATFGKGFTAMFWMVLEILCVEPIYPQYSGVLETCLALRYWFFEVLGSESVKSDIPASFTLRKYLLSQINDVIFLWWLPLVKRSAILWSHFASVIRSSKMIRFLFWGIDKLRLIEIF